MSTKNKTYKNNDSTTQAYYVSLTFGDNQYYSLDIDRDRLLIPRKVPSVIEYLYPEATGYCIKTISIQVTNKCNKTNYRWPKKIFNC